MTDDIPQWARDEVDKRAPIGVRHTSSGLAKYADELRDLAASLIAQHEEPPVDPLLIEAREIVAKFYEGNGGSIFSENFRAGKLDTTPPARVTLEGLRRGIELGKAGAA